LRGEGRGEGLFFEFEKKRLENPIQVVNNFVVPNPDHTITEGREIAVTGPVLSAFRMLATVEFNN